MPPDTTAESTLAEREQRSHWALQSAGAGAWDWDLEKGTLWWSDEMYSLFGCDPAEGIRPGLTLPVIDERDRPSVQRAIDTTVSSGADFRFEFRINHPQLGSRWMVSRGRVSRDAAGVPRRLLGITLDLTERLRAEQAALERAQRLRAILETAVEGIISIDEQGVIESANPAALSMFGYTSDELVGRNVSLLMPSPVQEVHDVYLRHHLATGERRIIGIGREVEGLRRNGEVFPLELSVVETWSEGRRFFTGFVRDVSTRKLAEDAVRERERIIQLYLQATPAAVAMFDRDMRYLIVSRQWVDDYGLDARDIIGRRHDDVFPEDRDRWRAAHARALAGETVECEEEELVRPDGRVDWMRWKLCPWTTAAGEIGGIILFSEVITPRKLAAESLRQSEQRFRSIYENAGTGIAIISRAGRFERCNPAYGAITGYTEAELCGRPFDAITHADDRAHNLRLMERLVQGEIPSFDTRNRCVHKSGRTVWVHTFVSVLRDEQSRGTHLIALVTDITERMTLERELLEVAERERQQIGHELHDDLGQILHGVQFLAGELRSRLERRGLPEAGELRRMERYLDQAVASIRNLAHGLQPVPPLPEGLMLGLREHARRTREIYHLSCRFLCPHPVHIADKTTANHLFRIAQEAVYNAIKHARCKRIVIWLAQNPERTVLAIADDGNGRIPASDQRRGMGLHVMQFRAAAVNGSLAIQRRPRGGTAIICTLKAPPPTPAAEGSRPAHI